MLPTDRMPEAEVSLRAATALLARGVVASDIMVAIDGAQVRTGDAVHFAPREFLAAMGWHCYAPDPTWRGRYEHPGHESAIVVHSAPGKGDIVAALKDGRTIRVESKKGPLADSKSSSEYPLMREAIGQLMTVNECTPNDLLAIVVPESRKFSALAAQWRKAPLMARLGIQIWTVDRANSLLGFDSGDS